MKKSSCVCSGARGTKIPHSRSSSLVKATGASQAALMRPSARRCSSTLSPSRGTLQKPEARQRIWSIAIRTRPGCARSSDSRAHTGTVTVGSARMGSFTPSIQHHRRDVGPAAASQVGPSSSLRALRAVLQHHAAQAGPDVLGMLIPLPGPAPRVAVVHEALTHLLAVDPFPQQV